MKYPFKGIKIVYDLKVCGIGIRMQKISKVCQLARRVKVNSMEDLYYLYRIEELIYNIKL